MSGWSVRGLVCFSKVICPGWGGKEEGGGAGARSVVQGFRVLSCRWKKEAEKEGILPQYVESSFLDNPKLLLGSNDTMVMDVCDREQGFKDSTECCEKFGPTDCSSTQTTAYMPRLLEKSNLNQLMKVFILMSCSFTEKPPCGS